MLKSVALLVALVSVAAVLAAAEEKACKVQILSEMLDKDEPYFEYCLKEKAEIVAAIGQYSIKIKQYIADYKKGGNKATPTERATFISLTEELVTAARKFIHDEDQALNMGRVLIMEAEDAIAEVRNEK